MAMAFPLLSDLKRAAVDLLFPRWCLGCGREGEYICGTCLRNVKEISPPACPRCGRPQNVGAAQKDCPNCEEWRRDIDCIRAPFLFDGLIRNAIHEFKYRNLRTLAPLLAGLLHSYVTENRIAGDVLVPVPLHRKRLRERGYNQSALLARGLGRLNGLPVVADCLVRRRYNPPQARSSGISERLENVNGNFACRDGRLQGKEVILIDDVSTSGATLNACAGALKAAGAAAVRGLVIALEL